MGVPMRAEELKQLLRRRPFVPLRLNLTDGAEYDIRHPDNILVLKSQIDIGVGADDKTGMLDAVDYLSLLHMSVSKICRR